MARLCLPQLQAQAAALTRSLTLPTLHISSISTDRSTSIRTRIRSPGYVRVIFFGIRQIDCFSVPLSRQSSNYPNLHVVITDLDSPSGQPMVRSRFSKFFEQNNQKLDFSLVFFLRRGATIFTFKPILKD